MATNYTFSQVCEIINEGKNTEALIDIGRRYPLLMCAVSKVTAVAGDSFVELMGYLPDHLTANKVYNAMKAGANNDATSDDADDDDAASSEKEAEEPKAAKKEKKANESSNDAGEKSYESMSGKELWDILGKAGKRKDCKEKMGGCKKEQMVEYINKYGLGADPTEEAEEPAEEAEAEEAKENPYDGMSAMELFKECKKRGIKAAPKQKAKAYVELLLKDDAEKAASDEDSEEENTESDGWDDDDAEEETPKKATKAPKEKNAKAKKAAKEEDDDDDWEI